MPYSTIAAAKGAGFPTHAEDIALTIAQINKLSEIYDAIKKAGTVDVPMAATWTSWKKLYAKKEDKWILVKKEGEHETNTEWIAVAKKDQERVFEDGRVEILDERGIISSVNSFKDKGVEINHKVPFDSAHKILDTKYTPPFLYMKFDKLTNGIFRNSDATGWSVKFDPASMKYEGNRIVDARGKNISILYYPHMPACTPEMGCFETVNFDINKSEKKESKLMKMVEDIRSGFEGMKEILKGVTLLKSEKKEEYNQEENLDKKEDMEKVDELTSELKTTNDELTKVKGEFETKKTDHNKEVKELKDKIGEFEQEKADAVKAKRDGDWEQLKKTVIPKGLVHKEEDEKKLKAEFEQSPHEFMMKMVEFEKHEEGREEGAAYETKGANEVEELKKETWG